MSGSFHLDSSSNVGIGVEIWLFIHFVGSCCVKRKCCGFFLNHATFFKSWKCLKINFTGTVLKTQQPIYPKFNANFVIQRPVQMTKSGY